MKTKINALKQKFPNTFRVGVMLIACLFLTASWCVYYNFVWQPVEAYNIQPANVMKHTEELPEHTDGLTFQYTYNGKEYDGDHVYNYKEKEIPNQISNLKVSPLFPNIYLRLTTKDLIELFFIITLISLVLIMFIFVIEKIDKKLSCKQKG